MTWPFQSSSCRVKSAGWQFQFTRLEISVKSPRSLRFLSKSRYYLWNKIKSNCMTLPSNMCNSNSRKFENWKRGTLSSLAFFVLPALHPNSVFRKRHTQLGPLVLVLLEWKNKKNDWARASCCHTYRPRIILVPYVVMWTGVKTPIGQNVLPFSSTNPNLKSNKTSIYFRRQKSSVFVVIVAFDWLRLLLLFKWQEGVDA